MSFVPSRGNSASSGSEFHKAPRVMASVVCSDPVASDTAWKAPHALGPDGDLRNAALHVWDLQAVLVSSFLQRPGAQLPVVGVASQHDAPPEGGSERGGVIQDGARKLLQPPDVGCRHGVQSALPH